MAPANTNDGTAAVDAPWPNPLSAAQAVEVVEQRLRDSNVNKSARLDAELLVGGVCELDRVKLRTRGDETLLSDAQKMALKRVTIQRAKGEPIAYLLGYAWFYGRKFKVDSRVLIPRPETEQLVDLALEHLERWEGRGVEHNFVADVCTGSGCVGISIAAESAKRFGDTEVRVVCTDISEDAIDVARENAAEHAPDVYFREGDLLQPISELGPFAAVVANPPYIDGPDAEGLEDAVREYEPQIALFAPAEGVLAFYDRLAREAYDLLDDEGLIAIEHGIDQGAQLVKVLELCGFERVTSHNDLAGIDRVVTGIKPASDSDDSA